MTIDDILRVLVVGTGTMRWKIALVDKIAGQTAGFHCGRDR